MQKHWILMLKLFMIRLLIKILLHIQFAYTDTTSCAVLYEQKMAARVKC